MPDGIQTHYPFFTFENSNEKQKHNIKSLSGIQTHLPLITLIKRTEVDDNCIYVVLWLILVERLSLFSTGCFQEKDKDISATNVRQPSKGDSSLLPFSLCSLQFRSFLNLHRQWNSNFFSLAFTLAIPFFESTHLRLLSNYTSALQLFQTDKE